MSRAARSVRGEGARVLSPFFISLGLFACNTPDPAEVREVGRISRAVEQITQAERQEKGAQFAVLRDTKCEKFCELKKECQDAYYAHIQGIRNLALGERSVKEAIGKERAQEILDLAEKQLKEAQPAIDACIDKIQKKKREMGI